MIEKKKNRFVKSKGFLMLIAIFLFILILAFFFGDSGIIEIIKSQKKIEELNETINKLEQKKKKLVNEIRELKKNPLALEKKAREKLWLMKKNEKVIVIIKNKNKEKDKETKRF